MDVDMKTHNIADTPNLDAQRQIILDLISAACVKNADWSTLSYQKRSSIVRRIERSCHRAAIHSCEKDRIDRTWDEPKFVGRYSANCYRVLANLDPNSSVGATYLGNMIISGGIDPRVAGEVSSATLYPDGSAKEHDIIAVRREQKIQEKFSQKYKCSKCQARKCVWYGVQTRGLDEPEDKHCKCLDCGHEWKERD